MRIFPKVDKTIVTSLSDQDIISNLSIHTRIVNTKAQSGMDIKYYGSISDNKFRITAYPLSPQYSNALAIGKIDKTNNGCIVFLKYRLFPSAKWFLGLSIILALVISIIMIWQHDKYISGSLVFGAAIANYILVTHVFHRLANVLHQTLSEEFGN